MKLTVASVILSTASSFDLILAKDPVFTPNRISHDRLSADPLQVPNESLLVDSLSTDGLLSITSIPGFGKIKMDMMAQLHACIIDQGDAFPQQILKDGTVRRTIGTNTIPADNGTVPQPIAWRESDDDLSESCKAFSKNLDSFRAKVDETTAAFADRLSFEMGASLSTPLMTTRDGSHSFNEIKDIVSSGEHLEHFHSYQKIVQASEGQTIDLHVDQGFFIAFTPGLVVTHTEEMKPDTSKSPLVQSEGFYVETANGKRSLVQFDASDDLVFLLGDGADQYINNNLKGDATSQQKKLRVAPHAVSLTTHDDSLARVWYGRMILPPKDAFNAGTDQTYGDIRSVLSTTPKGERQAGIGCSSTTMRALATDEDGHENHGTTCEAGSIYCWFRCMEHLPFGIVDESTCTDQGLDLKCINPRRQLSDGHVHGDYFPACTDSTEEATPYPKLPEFPQNETVCHADKWDVFSIVDAYDHTFDLSTDKTSAMFQWTVKDGNTIAARLAFNGIFGWLGMGFLNLDPEANHNGMNGANILLALPGDSYTAFDGLNLDGAHNVQEYQISHGDSAFRHWQNSTNANPNAQVEYDGCFTAITFELDSINGVTFDTEGKNHMLWAGNSMDRYVGYHLQNRAIFTVEWSKGLAYFGKKQEEEGGSTSGASSVSNSFLSLLSATIISLIAFIF